MQNRIYPQSPASFNGASDLHHFGNSKPAHGPILKWAGGKLKLLPQLQPLLAEVPGERLIEPFVGAGSVFLSTDYDEYVIGDANTDLIATYTALQKRPHEFIERAYQFFVQHNLTQEAFLRIRKEFNALSDPFERAVRLPYLNSHCFNGLFRTNNSGDFNTSFGKPKKVPHMHIDRMLAAARKLQSTVVVNGGFEETLKFVRAEVKVSHRADWVVSQGWKPTQRWSAVDKCMPCLVD